jgi:hypothetical protein
VSWGRNLAVRRESARKKKTIRAKRMVETPPVADVRNIQVGMKLLLTNDKNISPCSPGCLDMRDSVGESGIKSSWPEGTCRTRQRLLTQAHVFGRKVRGSREHRLQILLQIFQGGFCKRLDQPYFE